MAEAFLLFPKLVVFGASGDSGREVVQQALAKGHSVTAVVRKPSEIQPEVSLYVIFNFFYIYQYHTATITEILRCC